MDIQSDESEVAAGSSELAGPSTNGEPKIEDSFLMPPPKKLPPWRKRRATVIQYADSELLHEKRPYEFPLVNPMEEMDNFIEKLLEEGSSDLSMQPFNADDNYEYYSDEHEEQHEALDLSLSKPVTQYQDQEDVAPDNEEHHEQHEE